MKKVALLLCLLLCTSSLGMAQKKYELAYKLKPGKKFEQVSKIDMPMTMSTEGESIEMHMQMTISSMIECLEVQRDRIKMRFTHLSLKGQVSLPAFGVDTSIDTESPKEDKSMELVKAMMKKPIDYTMASNGKILELLDAKDLEAALREALPTNVANDEMLEQICKGILNSAFGGFLLPEKTIAVGETWVHDYTIQQPGFGNEGLEFTTASKMTQKLDAVSKTNYEVSATSDLAVKNQGVELKGVAQFKNRYNKKNSVLESSVGTLDLGGDYPLNGDMQLTVSCKGSIETQIKAAN